MKRNSKLILHLGLVLFICSCTPKYDVSKLDCWNNITMNRVISSGNLYSINQIAEKLNVSIKMDVQPDRIQKLTELGVEPRSVTNNVITAEVPLNKLLKITEFDWVKAIKIYETRHNFIGLPDSVNTKLFIGVIDDGFGFNKDIFSDRVFSYWDQTIKSKTAGTSIPGLNYGIEYSKLDIQRKLYSQGMDRMGLHGSFCAMLAAGNNLSGYVKNIDKDEFGTVESPLIVVQTTKDEGDIIDAIYYVKEISRKYNAKCVINLSESKHSGAHDGTSFLAQSINNLISDSCLIVVSSGNDGNACLHNRHTVLDSAAIEFSIAESPFTNSFKNGYYLHGYYNKSNDIEVKLMSPKKTYDYVKKGEWKDYVDGNTRITIANGISKDMTTSTRDIMIVCEPRLNNSTDDYQKDVINSQMVGDWKIVLRNRNSADTVVFNSWIVSQLGYSGEFKSKEDCFITSSDLCSAPKIISVGGYSTKNDSLFLSPFSSKSLVDGKLSLPNCLAPFEIHMEKSGKSADGTSFSAPLVVRTIAKIWESYPELPGSKIKEFLKNKIIVFDGTDYFAKTGLDHTIVNWKDIDLNFKNNKNRN